MTKNAPSGTVFPADFKGAAKRIDDIDIPAIADTIGVGEDEVHAFIEAETRGSGFDDLGRPRILFERHKFYKYCPPDKRAAAVKAGLANPRAGGYGKESEQYAKLRKAMAIDAHAALLSCSWGLAQVMGFNHALAGYATVEAMIAAFTQDEEHHLRAAVSFIKASGLDGALRRHHWKAFAKGYNGSGYAVNKYDAKLATAFAKWQKIRDTPWSREQDIGAADAQAAAPAGNGAVSTIQIRLVQERLKEIGYSEVGTADGKLGKMTKTAILAFRNEHDLPLSDTIDDALLAALDSAKARDLPRNDAKPAEIRAAAPEVQSNWLTKLGAGAAAGVTAVAGAGDAVLAKLSPWRSFLAETPTWLWFAIAAAVFAAIFLVARRGEAKGVEAFQAGERR